MVKTYEIKGRINKFARAPLKLKYVRLGQGKTNKCYDYGRYGWRKMKLGDEKHYYDMIDFNKARVAASRYRQRHKDFYVKSHWIQHEDGGGLGTLTRMPAPVRDYYDGGPNG